MNLVIRPAQQVLAIHDLDVGRSLRVEHRSDHLLVESAYQTILLFKLEILDVLHSHLDRTLPGRLLIRFH